MKCAYIADAQKREWNSYLPTISSNFSYMYLAVISFYAVAFQRVLPLVKPLYLHRNGKVVLQLCCDANIIYVGLFSDKIEIALEISVNKIKFELKVNHLQMFQFWYVFGRVLYNLHIVYLFLNNRLLVCIYNATLHLYIHCVHIWKLPTVNF